MAKILYLGTAGSDDAGHQPEIFLAGEAAYFMKNSVLGAVRPVAMPALKEMLDELIAQNVPSTSETRPAPSPSRTASSASRSASSSDEMDGPSLGRSSSGIVRMAPDR